MFLHFLSHRQFWIASLRLFFSHWSRILYWIFSLYNLVLKILRSDTLTKNYISVTTFLIIFLFIYNLTAIYQESDQWNKGALLSYLGWTCLILISYPSKSFTRRLFIIYPTFSFPRTQRRKHITTVSQNPYSLFYITFPDLFRLRSIWYVNHLYSVCITLERMLFKSENVFLRTANSWNRPNNGFLPEYSYSTLFKFRLFLLTPHTFI